MPEEAPMPKSKSKRNKIVLLTTIIVVAALGIWYALAAQSSSKKATTAKQETKTAAEVEKSDDLSKPTDTTNASGDTTTSSSNNQNLSITVSRPVNGDTLPLSENLEIRTVISGATSGTCNLSASGPNGKSVTKSVSIAAQPSYGSCSIDIASSQLSAGEWQIAITATSGSSTGKTNFKVTLQ